MKQLIMTLLKKQKSASVGGRGRGHDQGRRRRGGPDDLSYFFSVELS